MFARELQDNPPWKSPVSDDLASTLNGAYDRLSASPSMAEIDGLANSLAHLFDDFNAEGRLHHFKQACQAHPLHDLILEDPYSRRAFDKPRGYAGDAVMLDYIYRSGHDRNLAGRADISPTGRIVHEATTRLPSAKSILWRRQYLSEKICSAAEMDPRCRILSVACGHLRELDLVRRETRSRDFGIIALDQDSCSLDEAVSSYADFNVSCLNKSFSYLLRGIQDSPGFSLIYSAGLFDYLGDRPAKMLVRSLYRSLESGGMLTIANFTPANHGRGFMEGFMDWSLIYRDEDAMVGLIEGSVPGGSYNIFQDDHCNVVYAEVWKT